MYNEEKDKEQVDNIVEDTQPNAEQVEEAIENLKEAAESVLEDVKEELGETFEGVKEFAENVSEKVKEAAKEINEDGAIANTSNGLTIDVKAIDGVSIVQKEIDLGDKHKQLTIVGSKHQDYEKLFSLLAYLEEKIGD